MITSPEYRSIELRVRRGIDNSSQHRELLTIFEQLEQLQRSRADATERLRQEYEPRQRRLDEEFDQQHAETVQHLRRRLGLPQTRTVRSHQDNFGNDNIRPRASTTDFQMGENAQQEQAEPYEPTPSNHHSLFTQSSGMYNDFDEAFPGINSDISPPLIETAASLSMQAVYDGTFGPMPPRGSIQTVAARNDIARRDIDNEVGNVISPTNDCLCGQPSVDGSLAGCCETCAELFEVD